MSLKSHKKKKCEITSKKGRKDDNKETQLKAIECMKCNEKFESIEKLIGHVMEI